MPGSSSNSRMSLTASRTPFTGDTPVLSRQASSHLGQRLFIKDFIFSMFSGSPETPNVPYSRVRKTATDSPASTVACHVAQAVGRGTHIGAFSFGRAAVRHVGEALGGQVVPRNVFQDDAVCDQHISGLDGVDDVRRVGHDRTEHELGARLVGLDVGRVHVDGLPVHVERPDGGP